MNPRGIPLVKVSQCIVARTIGLFFFGVLCAQGKILFTTDFNTSLPAGMAVAGTDVTPATDRAKLTRGLFGTVDQFQGTPSSAPALKVNFTGAPAGATFGLATGKLPIANTETDLALLTVGFDLWVNRIHPVQMRIESFDRSGKLTGSRRGEVTPPVAGSFYRFEVDLHHTVAGEGVFDPQAPLVQFTFAVDAPTGIAPLPHTDSYEFRIDNLSYTAPSYFVSANGNDTRDGRTAATAFSTVQHAIDLAVPGDVIYVLDGTYTAATAPDIRDVPREIVNAPVWRPWWVRTNGSVCNVAKAGTPAAWIVVRNYPGQHPRFFNRAGWAAFSIDLGTAYFELRGLTLQGNGANLKLADAQRDGDITERGGWRYYGDAAWNGNGVMVDGRATKDPAQRAHHLRFIDNTVSDFPAAGIAAIGADYVTLEGNTIFNNVHFTRWGASGISFLRASNFDESTGHKMFVLGNRSYLNRCYVPWVNYESDAQGNPVPNSTAPKSPMSDGNGIIIDVNRRRHLSAENSWDFDYVGRTLVSNNLSYGNGGGGIVLTTVQHVDVVNNTVFDNVQTPELVPRGWGDLMVGGPSPGCADVTVINNIVYAKHARAVLNINYLTQTQPLLIKNNLLYGGTAGPSDWPQQATLQVDPRFIEASLDPARANFHVQPHSPALGAGAAEPAQLVPITGLDGHRRAPSGAPTLGALP